MVGFKCPVNRTGRVERESARRSSWKGREGAFVNQTNTGTEQTATLGHLTKDYLEGERLRKRRRSSIILGRAIKGLRQLDQHWCCFENNPRESSERLMGLSAHGLPLPRSYQLQLNGRGVPQGPQALRFS